MEISSEYAIHLGILFLIYSLSAQAFNVVFGLAGLFNLAHVACYAVGAYATAILATNFQLSFFQCCWASIAFSGLTAFVVGEISLRLSKDYFALGTLACSAIVSSLLINWKGLTRGVLGIPGIPRPSTLGIDLESNANFLTVIAPIWMIAQVILWSICRSPFARALRASGEYELSTSALGYDLRLLRILAFFVSSCLCGLAGCFFAFYLNYIDPSSFTLTEMVLVLTIAVVAKPGSYWGIFPSTALLVVIIPETLRRFELPSSVLGPMRQLIYAFILFLIVLVKKNSLFPKQREA